MSGPSAVKEVPISGRDQLVEYLASGAKPREAWRIGTEHEKFGFRLDDLRPPTFDGERGIEALLGGLTRFGWQPYQESVDGQQALIGLAMGYVTMLLFSAIGAAGSLIDLFGGFALAAAWDPLGMNMNTVFGRFHQMLATVLLLATGGHLLVIGGLLSTFKFLPLTGLPDISGWDGVLATAFSMFFTVAVQMALPMIAVLFVADLALALLTKVAPQLNALNVMFPAKVGLTLLLLGMSFPMLPQAVEHLVGLANEAMATMAGA